MQGEKNVAKDLASKTNLAQSVIIKTNVGDIELALFTNKAPLTVENFVKLSEAGFYNGTLFHRVIKDFMIQSGDPLSKESNWALHGTGGPGYAFKDEINDEKLVRGVLAMANAGPNTNGSQFFIVTAEKTPWLDGKHTAFGKVIKGMDVVDKISMVEVNEQSHPLRDVVIEQIVLK
ncbi:MAG: peptidylprolyl isomerase [Parcubacteria group bacterium]|nr:peptidylprolyl isomerase [Parcubacteria group bacterium]